MALSWKMLRFAVLTRRRSNNENNRIKLPISSRYVAMGCGRGLYARNEGVGLAVVYRCVCVVG